MKKIYFILLFICSSSLLFSQNTQQNVIASSGGNIQNSNVNVSWTLGEVVISTLEGSSVILTQGFHQGDYTITSTGYTRLSDITLSLYPNPARDFINVDVKTDKTGSYRVELIDVSGKVLVNKAFYSNLFKVNLRGFSPSIYYLRITDEKGKFLGSYKILKHGFIK